MNTFGAPENAGFVEIDFSKERKMKEKKQLAYPNEYSSIFKFNNENNVSNAFLHYYVYKSDSYRYLGTSLFNSRKDNSRECNL